MKAAGSYRGGIGDMKFGVPMSKKSRYRLMGFLFISLIALFAFASYTPVAYASSGYFTGAGGCSGCHVGQTGSNFCGMCHAHGTHPSSAKSSINVTAATNKATYAPGETVSVTISGGYRPSQARAILYDSSMTRVAISTGTSAAGDPVNAPVWPVTLSAPAPMTAGTYTWKAAWYGNKYDTGSAAFGGANWVPDGGNPNHGEERVNVSVTVVAATPTLTSIAIVGASSVNEGATSTYTATATWSDGTTSAATGATWSVTSGPATINAATGVLTGGSVTANTSAVIGASYTSGGVTKTASATVTIVDVPATAGTVTVFPSGGSTDVPVNTVVTATDNGSIDIRTIFNGSTFTLRPAVAMSDSSVGPSGPMSASVCVSGGIVQGSFTYDTANTSGTFTPNCVLAEGTTYLAAITNGAGSPLAAPVNWQFTTAIEGPDSDGDGSPDSEDNDPHNAAKAFRWSSKGNGKIQIDVTDSSGASINAAVALSDDNSRLNQTGKPATFVFHDGLVAYNVTGITPGSTITAKITFPSGIPAGSKVYQVDANGFHEMTNAVINGNTVTMTLTDGGAGDGDGIANGIIVDPVGVATPVSGSGSIGLTTGGASGGCSVAGRAGSGGGLMEAAGAYGFLTLAALGIALRGLIRRRKE